MPAGINHGLTCLELSATDAFLMTGDNQRQCETSQESFQYEARFGQYLICKRARGTVCGPARGRVFMTVWRVCYDASFDC